MNAYKFVFLSKRESRQGGAKRASKDSGNISHHHAASGSSLGNIFPLEAGNTNTRSERTTVVGEKLLNPP
jgi:hypothetical protein